MSATDKIVDLSFDSSIRRRVDKILASEEAGITVYLPKPMTSGIKGASASRRCITRQPSLFMRLV
jgi:hypothetical protein